MTGTPQSIVSGVAYPVTSIRDGSSLDDLVGETEFTIDLGSGAYVVRGAGNHLNEQIRFHEKSDVGGRDVRVWHVRAGEGGLTAEHVAAF